VSGNLITETDAWGFTASGADKSLLSMFVAVSVPLRLAGLQKKGGPSDLDYELARGFAEELAEHGDNLLYRGKKSGETARLANGLAHAIAVFAFQPGGVRIFGYHFEAKSEARP
jgi:hypothetical protein